MSITSTIVSVEKGADGHKHMQKSVAANVDFDKTVTVMLRPFLSNAVVDAGY